jgi:MYXO-CTERM domain-containing protein
MSKHELAGIRRFIGAGALGLTLSVAAAMPVLAQGTPTNTAAPAGAGTASNTAGTSTGTMATDAQSGGATAGGYNANNNAGDNDRGHNWGWLGLIGLAGLAGLRGRGRDDTVTGTRR